MAKVVQLHGQTPSGWKRDRWAWLDAVSSSPDLTASAKLLAGVLARKFANHETAECRPGLAALMGATGQPRRTAMRALSDLQAAGWIARMGGNAPGQGAAYVFRWPGKQVPTVAHEQVPTVAHEQVPTVAHEQVPNIAPTGAISCAPPIPPYKDKPNMNQMTPPAKPISISAQIRGPEQPKVLTHVIAPGSSREAAWDDWLKEHGHPPLSEIGFKVQGGFKMPVSFAPRAAEQIPYAIALRWVAWLRSKA